MISWSSPHAEVLRTLSRAPPPQETVTAREATSCRNADSAPVVSQSYINVRSLRIHSLLSHISRSDPSVPHAIQERTGDEQVIKAFRQPSYITIRKLHPLTTDSGLTLIVKCLWSIPLVIAHSGFIRAVHWQLEVVGSQSVKVGVMVREQSTLIQIFSHR